MASYELFNAICNTAETVQKHMLRPSSYSATSAAGALLLAMAMSSPLLPVSAVVEREVARMRGNAIAFTVAARSVRGRFATQNQLPQLWHQRN